MSHPLPDSSLPPPPSVTLFPRRLPRAEKTTRPQKFPAVRRTVIPDTSRIRKSLIFRHLQTSPKGRRVCIDLWVSPYCRRFLPCAPSNRGTPKNEYSNRECL